MANREHTRVIHIGDRVIGGGNPILIQSMTNTRTEDVEATVAQILRLEKAGCEIIRCTVPTLEAAQAIREIRKQIHIPLVADIHFDYKMAIAAIENGADKIRINPGNIGGREKLSAVVSAAKEHNIPIRVGVNSGSLEKELVEKYHGVTAEGIVESALDKVHMIEEEGYENMVISIKSSDVLMCVRAHEILSQKTDYPLHVGITEAGTIISGNIKSSIGLGLILHQGIGDTIRVSLTGDPVEEIKSAKIILRTLGLRKGGIEVVSCPTCGRTKIDLIGLANQVETMVAEFPLNIKVAVMGCAVNGPGEAKEADLGIAGGINEGLLIKKGEIIRKVPRISFYPCFGRNWSIGNRRLERRTGMEKSFFDVFPKLNLDKKSSELFEQVTVCKVSATKSRDFVRVSIVSDYLIPKETIYKVEKEIKRQFFDKHPVTVELYESFHLSEQYTPENLMREYESSILLELREYSPVEYNIFKMADLSYPKENQILITAEDTVLAEVSHRSFCGS